MLSDREIKALIKKGILADAREELVGPVTYDLRTDALYLDNQKLNQVDLAPGDSVFVGSKETIKLPHDLTARVFLKNSRIRQGLTLDAPVYFPGHETVVYFRVTNVSGNCISIDSSKNLAQIAFERVDGVVDAPYEGAFNKEFDYRNLGDYTDVYREDIRQVENKVDEIKGVERRIYSAVLALMAIFAAIFSLVNVNVSALANAYGPMSIVVINLVTVGSFALLCGLIAWIMRPESGRAVRCMLGLGAVAFAMAIVLVFCAW